MVPKSIIITSAGELLNDRYLGALIQSAPTATSSEIASRSGNRLQEDALKTAINAMTRSESPLKVGDALKAAKEAILNPPPSSNN